MHALSMHECKHACMYCIALYLRLLGTTIQHGMSESIHLQFMQTNKATLSIHPCMYVRTYVCMYYVCMHICFRMPKFMLLWISINALVRTYIQYSHIV